MLDGSGIFFAEQCLEFGESLLDRVEVGAVGRQEDELGAGVSEGTAHRAGFVAAEIVHHHDVAGPQGWDQELDYPCQEALGVDRPVEHARGHDAVTSQTRHEGQRFPMAMRHLGEQSLANRAAAVQSGHVCLRPGLVDKDYSPRINLALQALPQRAPPGNVRPVLLGRA